MEKSSNWSFFCSMGIEYPLSKCFHWCISILINLLRPKFSCYDFSGVDNPHYHLARFTKQKMWYCCVNLQLNLLAKWRAQRRTILWFNIESHNSWLVCFLIIICTYIMGHYIRRIHLKSNTKFTPPYAEGSILQMNHVWLLANTEANVEQRTCHGKKTASQPLKL